MSKPTVAQANPIWAQHFTQASVLLPVINETISLRETIRTIEEQAATRVGEYWLLLDAHTTSASTHICEEFVRQNPNRFYIHRQHLPFLGGALREGFALARGSHVILMSSDLETDPNTVLKLIEASTLHPNAVITATRWRNGGGFEGYNKIKLGLNFMFQRIFALLYRTKLSDLTFGYRIFPTTLVQSIRWRELRHPFVLETLLKPLRMQTEILEVPTRWRARTDGSSTQRFWKSFAYFSTALSVRFEHQYQFYKETPNPKA